MVLASSTDSAFPCRCLPEDPAAVRRLGLYGQRQPGLFMQRVRIPLGRLSSEQLRGLATLAAKFTQGTPLRITIRQDIEFHDLRADDIPPLQAGIYDLGMTTVDSGGDAIRNVVACPGNGLLEGSWDVAPLAAAICRQAAAMSEGTTLPRKFKISLSGCPEGCARPWINDFGVVVRGDGLVDVMLAGSLGARPGLAISYAEALPPGEIPALFAAALRLFHREGDRQNRHRARLRHVRERLGDNEFRSRIDGLFAAAKASVSSSPSILLHRVETALPHHLRIQPLLGELTPAEACAVADAVTLDNRGEIRLGLDLDIHLFADHPPIVPASLPASLDSSVALGAVVACPGTHWCSHGIADTRKLALRIHEALPSGSTLTIAITGCPNNCSQAAVADIGLVGRIKTVDGQPREHYRLLVGGGHGMTSELAVELHPAVPAEAIPDIVASMVEEFADSANGIPFAKFAVDRAEAWQRHLDERFVKNDKR